MEIHHGKHHNAYVTNLNKALEGQGELQKLNLQELLADNCAKVPTIRGAVRNNGGGHHNHSLFWTWLSPQGGGEAPGELGSAISTAFGSFEKFKELFNQAATTRFGSGWAWLVWSEEGKLHIYSTANQDSPVIGDTHFPLLQLSMLGTCLLPALPKPSPQLCRCLEPGQLEQG